MKYYVVQETWDTKTNELLKIERITGYTEHIDWAQYCLNFYFNEKLKNEKESIDLKSLSMSTTEYSFALKENNTRYVIYITDLPDKKEFEPAEIILALNNYYRGDWDKVYEAMTKHEDVQKEWLGINKAPAITILDPEYPKKFKNVYKPPFAFYYIGDLKLLSSESYNRLAVTVCRTPYTDLLAKAEEDIKDLPQNIIIVTADKRIAEYALDDSNPHKVILVKADGLDQPTDAEIEYKVIKNDGLIVTHRPEGSPTSSVEFLDRNKIISGVADALLVVQALSQSSSTMLAELFFNNEKDVMVYPTFPDSACVNNRMIWQDKAQLVENAKDMEEILKLL